LAIAIAPHFTEESPVLKMQRCGIWIGQETILAAPRFFSLVFL
jgi:hypothetical protein